MQVCGKVWVKADRAIRDPQRLEQLYLWELFGVIVDSARGHTEEKHASTQTMRYLYERLKNEQEAARLKGLEWEIPGSTQFLSGFHESYARQKFLETYKDQMRDWSSERFSKTVDVPFSAGRGYDAAGNEVENITTVRFTYKWDKERQVWKEVSGFPVAKSGTIIGPATKK